MSMCRHKLCKSRGEEVFQMDGLHKFNHFPVARIIAVMPIVQIVTPANCHMTECSRAALPQRRNPFLWIPGITHAANFIAAPALKSIE